MYKKALFSPTVALLLLVTLLLTSPPTSAEWREDKWEKLPPLPSPPVSQWDIWKYATSTHQYKEMNLYPGTTEISFPYVTLPRETKDVAHYLLLGHIKASGKYTLIFHVPYKNPYDKYNHWVGWFHLAFTDPYDLTKGGIYYTWNPVAFLVSREQTYESQYVKYEFEAQKTGDIYCFVQSHSVITDINGDGKVGIADIFYIAKNYGKHIQWGTPEYACDMDCDLYITMNDVGLIAIDFGRTIPP